MQGGVSVAQIVDFCQAQYRLHLFWYIQTSFSLQVSSESDLAWSFNLSHQGDYAVLAAEQGRQVGVDIMKTAMPGKHCGSLVRIPLPIYEMTTFLDSFSYEIPPQGVAAASYMYSID